MPFLPVDHPFAIYDAIIIYVVGGSEIALEDARESFEKGYSSFFATLLLPSIDD
jgi:hypothetical protein